MAKQARKIEFYTANCPICGDEFSRPLDLVENSRKKGAVNIVCSRECGATAGAQLIKKRKAEAAAEV